MPSIAQDICYLRLPARLNGGWMLCENFLHVLQDLGLVRSEICFFERIRLVIVEFILNWCR